MLLRKLKCILERLDNPNHPLLGPNIRSLYWLGLWQGEDKYRNFFSNFAHFSFFVFVITEFIELYFMRNDLMQVLFNSSVTVLSFVSTNKCIFVILYLKRWKSLVEKISREEISAIENNDPKVMDIMKEYKAYSRGMTYFYWIVALMTGLSVLLTPFIKYVTMPTYREMIKNGTEPYPQILSSWFPFDKTKMPGYLGAVSIQFASVSMGAAIPAVYDATAVAIMTFLKGQLQILRYKCKHIFGDDESLSKEQILNNIKECHRLHNFIIEQHTTFNNIISPAMFIYVLLCSIMICFSVVQLSMKEVTISQKILVLEYTVALAFELFLYCWHSNEIIYESNSVDLGVYTSNWWRADVQVRKQVLLLAGKLSPTYVLDAGPFATFSTSTFINILKGSYSFYTLFTQAHED